MVASGNVGRFVRPPVFEVGFNQNQNPLQDQSYLISKILDYKFLGNCAPTPPLCQHFALSEK